MCFGLEYLQLQNNQLEGIIPEAICGLGLNWGSVYNFNISENLCPPYPACVVEIDLNQNIVNCAGVVSLWDSLYYAESITEFDFSNTGLTGNIPSEIGLFTNLNYLNLSNNNLNGSIPNELGELINLEYLNIAFNQLNGPIPNNVGNLNSLKELRLFQNELSGSYLLN